MSASAIGPSVNEAPAAGKDYVLGHSEVEFRRLERQAAFFRDLTEELLRRAGITAGMRVLDLGSGVGDVSLLAAELVGVSGSVLGIERTPEAVETARRRAAAAGKPQVSFVVTEIDSFATEERFDAVIGRLVLMYLPDPAASLRRATAFLRPGGVVAFHEMCMPMSRSVPDGALVRLTLERMIATFRRAGFEVDMGARLPQVFAAAGLPLPDTVAGCRAGAGPRSPAYDQIAGVLRSLLPAAERFGIVKPGEVEIDTLADRLRDEAVAANATIFSPTMVGAWTRLPG